MSFWCRKKSISSLGLGLLLSWPSSAQLSLKYLVQPMSQGPCLASLVGPPNSAQQCISYNNNVDAAPTGEKSRRYIFTGSGDSYLYVIDSDTGVLKEVIKTVGRVTTNIIFSADNTKLFFGTDEGIVAGYDAYSFAPLFSFQANSRLNNDLIIINNNLAFSTSLASVYTINILTGEELWRVDRPVNEPGHDRIKLASYSNIIFLKNEHSFAGPDIIVVPHPDGYVSVFDARDGRTVHTIRLGQSSALKRADPDIVAPMLYIEGSIWVASMEFGIVRIDPRGGQIIGQTHEKQVQQLASDGSRVYAATFDSKYLLALSLGGDVIWKKDLSTKKTVGEYLGFPFNNFNVGFNRVFRGMPSRILLVNNNLILATGQGAIGLFTKNGDLIKEAGNSLGFGPKIGLIEDKSVVAVTRRGSLAKFSIDELNFTLANGQQAVGSFNGNGDLGKVVGNSLGFGPTLRFLGDEARRGSLALFLFDKLRKGGNQL